MRGESGGLGEEPSDRVPAHSEVLARKETGDCVETIAGERVPDVGPGSTGSLTSHL